MDSSTLSCLEFLADRCSRHGQELERELVLESVAPSDNRSWSVPVSA